MATDDLARSAFLGVLVVLAAFESAAAVHAWIRNGRSDRHARPAVLWLSPASAIRAHLARRRHEFDRVRWQYPFLRTSRHGHQVRDAIRMQLRQGMQVRPAMRVRQGMQLRPAMEVRPSRAGGARDVSVSVRPGGQPATRSASLEAGFVPSAELSRST